MTPPALRHAKPSTLEKVAPLLTSSKTFSTFGVTQATEALQGQFQDCHGQRTNELFDVSLFFA